MVESLSENWPYSIDLHQSEVVQLHDQEEGGYRESHST